MKKHQTFRLEETAIDSVKKLAKKENRSVSNVYECAVIAYVLLKTKSK